MILTCPECATRYFVDDARIGPEGRKVRCASCGHSWRGTAPDEAVAAFDEPMSFAAPSETDEAPVKLRSKPVSSQLREQAADKRKTREAAAVGAVWAVMGAGFCALMLGAVVFRVDIVRMAPATAGAYAFARLPVNPTGLAIDAVKGAPALQDGHATLKVEGVERNVETHPRDAFPLRVSLIDKAGHKVATQIANPPPGAIQPGETRPFSLNFMDPPLQAASFQVEFAFDAVKPARKPAPVVRRAVAATASPPAPLPSTQLQLRGSAPGPAPVAIPVKDAAPLPATSPYALPQASGQHG